MSCQIASIANIPIVDILRVKLGLIERIELPLPDALGTDEQDDNWEWDWQEPTSSNVQSSTASNKDPTWLQKCCLSLSPTGKVLALSYQKNIVILNAYLDTGEHNRDPRTEYNIISHGNICQPGEEITAVLCVPLLSQLKSSPSGTDWTCIVVGFSSGHVRFYTEDKKLLASEQLHTEPIIHLKCQSFKRASHSTVSEQPEEIYVVYPTCVVTLPGFSLFQTLRACRNQLARVQASGGGSIEAPPLTHTKWGYTDQDTVKDCLVVGSTSVNTFDHLMTASVCGGFDAHVKASAPAHSLVIASGRKPYIGYHYTFEGTSQPILLGVARAMANSIKSSQGLLAIKSYFSGGKTTQEKKAVATIEPPEPMGCRFGLCDLWRQGEAIYSSPNRMLSAVCDSLGRVVLVDNNKGSVLRMWKGYRDAQCAWIEVKEPASKAATSARTKHRPRVALFLVIYAPKKGIIEIWAMQQGPKVASFSVSKGGRLLYTNYGHVGVNNVPVKGSSRSQFPCIYVDPSGSLKEISVPFHFALSAQNSKQARDIHLLKKLRQFLKDSQGEEVPKYIEEIGCLVQDLWSSEAGLQALDLLIASKNTQPPHMQAALTSFLNKHDCQDNESMDLGTKTLLHTCQQYMNIVNFYIFLQEKISQPPSYESVMTTTNIQPRDLANQLHAPENEMECLMSLMTDVVKINQSTATQARVTFRDDAQSKFTGFLSCFEISSLAAAHKRPISLKKHLSEEKLKVACMQMYQGWLQPDLNLSEWLAKADESGVQAQSFLNLAINFWLQSHQHNLSSLETVGSSMLQFYSLLKGICTLADKSDISVHWNEFSPWWKLPRDILTNSDQPLKALTAAIVCRGIGLYLEAINEKKQITKDDSEECMEVDTSATEVESQANTGTDWEQVSMTTMMWNELTRQLEDLAVLDVILQRKVKTKQHCLSYSLKWKAASVSLGYILDKGKGAVSELVAGWVASTGIKPELLVDNLEDTEDTNSSLSPPASGKKSKKDVEVGVEATSVDPDAVEILDLVGKLRQHFPFSLSSNPLLASLFWEYIQDRSQIMNVREAALSSLNILRAIPSPHLRQGMCSLLWTLYLKQDFEKLTNYISKKSRRQLEELGLHEGNLPSYLEFCSQFLEAYLEANEESEVGTPIQLEYEDFWSECDVAPSLCQVALSKPTANFALLELHLQLASVLHMTAFFDLKVSNVVTNLFDSAGQAALFSDLCSHPRLPSHNPDQKLTHARTQFLCRVISASMQTIQVIDAGDIVDGEVTGPKVDASTSAEWMRSCLILANSWAVNSDILRRHQICDLYMNGHDRLAEENISSVNDEVLLGSQLLLIAGQRLQLAVMNSSDIAEKFSNMGTALSSWIKSVEVGNQCCASSLSDIEQIMSNVARLLPPDHKDNWLVQQLLDSCHHFINTDNDETT